MRKQAGRLGYSKPDFASIRLRAGREKSLLRRHPWVFSGAIERVDGQPTDGDTVRILTAKGEFLAWGAFSPRSNIRARVWSWHPDDIIGEEFLYTRLQAAIAARRVFFPARHSEALRLVHAESDGLPGLVVDQYSQWLSLQALSSGPERWLPQLVHLLQELTGLQNVYERSDVDVRRLEGLPERTGVLAGEAPPARLRIHENGVGLWVDLISGHKTGFYLDQRRNRLRLRSLAAGRRVLDCFCYSGGFSLNALAGGAATLTLVDASAEALELARANLELVTPKLGLCPASSDVKQTVSSHLAPDDVEQTVSLHPAPDDVEQTVSSRPTHTPIEYLQGDVFQQLRQMRDRARSFDLIILDPPKFAPTTAQVERAARGYKDINLLAFKLLAPGGLLVTFSCSGGVSSELFQKIVAGAALDASVEAQIIERLSQDNDHPVALNFPEGEYLKGLVVKIA